MAHETRQRASNWLIVTVTCAVLLLSYAALDDITTGSEANFTLEYVWLLVAAGWLLFVTFRVLRVRRGSPLAR